LKKFKHSFHKQNVFKDYLKVMEKSKNNVKNALIKLRRLFSDKRHRRPRAKSTEHNAPHTPWLAHYDAGVPKEIFIPNITLSDVLQKSVDVHRHKTAFYFYGKRFSYGQFDEAVQRVAGALQSLGISKGDRVALILPNSPQFLFVYWAALRIGAVVAPINPLLSGREVKNLIEMVEPRFVVVLDQLYHKMQKHLWTSSAPYMTITSIDEFMPRWVRMAFKFKKKVKDSKPLRPKAQQIKFHDLYHHARSDQPVNVKPDDTAALLFTGGVTGTPKAVQLTHYNLVANVLQTRAWLGDLKDGRDVVLGMLPFFHSYGMTSCHHLAIQTGAPLVVEPRFSVKRAIALTKKYKITLFPGVPTMYRALVDAIRDTKQTLDPVRICVSGGAPLSMSLKREFEELSNSKLVEGYGLSEASPLTHCNPLYGKEKVGSIGVPCPNTKARIVHLHTGKPVAAGSVGELEVNGPQVMSGYWQNDKETRKVLSRDGWLSTGDIAQMDSDGFFYIVDRKKDMIVSGGFNIYPSEVEDILCQYPGVKECAVVGVDDEYYGEQVKAFVVLKHGSVATKDELLAFCNDNLANFKVPRHIAFVNDLPKNFLGKVLRRQLSE
jgi:long-chain acyl-CoA synthetase